MSEKGEGQEEGERVDWVRGPKTADLKDVSVDKLTQHAIARGIRIEPDADHPNKTKVYQVTVEGMPAPSQPWWKKLFRI